LYDQIITLSPKVIIANGREACDSLYDLNLITKGWEDFRYDFPQKAYCECTLLPSGVEAKIYCTYHTSAQVVNPHVRRNYSEDTEHLLSKWLKELNNPLSIQWFLDYYLNTTNKGRGMRVLLLHWLDIGVSIRNAQ
jgi:hypothetical protein